MILFGIENRYCYGLNILFGTASFRRNMEWAWKALSVAITDTRMFKKKNVSTADARCAPVQAMIITDCIRNKKDKIFTTERCHYCLPIFPCIILSQVRWDCRICRLHLCGGVRLPLPMIVLDMTLNNWWWVSRLGSWGNVEYPFITVAP